MLYKFGYVSHCIEGKTNAVLTSAMQDTSTNPAVRRAFSDRVAPVEGEIKERLVGVQNDSSDSEDDGEAEGGAGNGGDGWESMEED